MMIARILKKIPIRDIWSIFVYYNPKSIFDLSDENSKFEIISRSLTLQFPNVATKADPFLYVADNTLYLFYEEVKQYGKGIIKMVSTNDLTKWTKPAKVLIENHHLSFPFVFFDNDKHYMIPETGSDNCIKLYCAKNFPYTWQKVHTLMDGNNYADTHIIWYDGYYFLYTTILTKENGVTSYELKLYFSKDLFGNWAEHPNSPLCKNLKYGRSAGSIIKYNNKMYRFTQDCTERYGSNISVFQINSLNCDLYEEQLIIDKLFDFSNKRSIIGAHQFNYCNYNGNDIVAVDHFRNESNFNRITQAIYNKIICLLCKKM